MEGGAAGGVVGAFVAALVGAEVGKLVSKETKVDLIVTPFVTIAAGGIIAKLIGPPVGAFMELLGQGIMYATELQPFWMGIIISLIVGLVLTSPISSSALCIMLGLSGLAAGAATIGGASHMIGFAVIGFRVNGIGGFFAHGLGTAMLQIPNVVKNPWILAPPVLASIVLGPVSTVLLRMENIPIGAGMGTSGFVGQIGALTAMGFTLDTLWKIVLLHYVLTGVLAFVFFLIFKKLGRIKDEDLRLSL